MGRIARHLIAAGSVWLAASAWAHAAQPESIGAQQVLVLLRLPADHLNPNGSSAGGYGYHDGAGRAARRRVAGRVAQEHGLSLDASWPMPLLGVDCFVMSVPPWRSPEEVVSELARDRHVAWSEPMHVYHAKAAAPRQPAVLQWRPVERRAMATGRR